MAGLLVKDTYLLVQRKQSLLLFLLISLVMGYTMDGSFIVGYMTLLGMILAVGTISYDEADNGLLFLMTLPTSRKTYALSKYVLGVIVCGIAWVAAVVLMFGMNAVKGLPMELEENLLGALTMLPIVVLALDVMVPIQLKFGAEKSRLVMALIAGGIMAAAVLLSRTLDDKADVNALLAALDRIPDLAFVLGAVVVCIAATLLSVAISVKVMEKKTV